ATREDPSLAFALSRLSDQDLTHTVTGIFRNIDRPTYDDGAREQLRHAKETKKADLAALLRGQDTWTVEE
ncbi:MAG TPA: 2-oxoacid:ferredoxin oxidoreductase subunit beta, partial [Pseudonocardiaceae bacterium]|nr:2-oxoacid:ferredoxin oxidoreductase subunit beta [Pseudonocardiaceae bacterium]